MKHERKMVLARPRYEGVDVLFGTWHYEDDPNVGHLRDLVTVSHEKSAFRAYEGAPASEYRTTINWSATGSQPIGQASFFAALMQEAVFVASLFESGALDIEKATALFGPDVASGKV
jgi:hypothetical protein